MTISYISRCSRAVSRLPEVPDNFRQTKFKSPGFLLGRELFYYVLSETMDLSSPEIAAVLKVCPTSLRGGARRVAVRISRGDVRTIYLLSRVATDLGVRLPNLPVDAAGRLRGAA